MKLGAVAAARSRSSALAASATGNALPLRPRPRPHSAHPIDRSLTAPNIITTTTTTAAEIGLNKTALRPYVVRVAVTKVAADTPRRHGVRSPSGSIVRTPPRAGQVPRDDLRRRGGDKPSLWHHQSSLRFP